MLVPETSPVAFLKLWPVRECHPPREWRPDRDAWCANWVRRGGCTTELSMGMSHDWAVAVRLGATLIRVGTAIFGARAPKATS